MYIKFNQTGEALGETFKLNEIRYETQGARLIAAGVAVAVTDQEFAAQQWAANNPDANTGSGGSGVKLLKYQHLQVPLTNTAITTEQDLLNFIIPANTLGPNSMLRIIFVASWTNSANIKNIRIRIGSLLAMAVAPTASVHGKYLFELANRNSMTSQVFGASGALVYGGTTTAALGIGAIDFSQDQTLRVTGQLATTGETINLESFLLELI